MPFMFEADFVDCESLSYAIHFPVEIYASPMSFCFRMNALFGSLRGEEMLKCEWVLSLNLLIVFSFCLI